MRDEIVGVVVGEVAAVDDVRAVAVEVERAVGADLEEVGWVRPSLQRASGRRTASSQSSAAGMGSEVLAFPGEPVELDQLLDAAGRVRVA